MLEAVETEYWKQTFYGENCKKNQDGLLLSPLS